MSESEDSNYEAHCKRPEYRNYSRDEGDDDDIENDEEEDIGGDENQNGENDENDEIEDIDEMGEMEGIDDIGEIEDIDEIGEIEEIEEIDEIEGIEEIDEMDEIDEVEEMDEIHEVDEIDEVDPDEVDEVGPAEVREVTPDDAEEVDTEEYDSDMIEIQEVESDNEEVNANEIEEEVDKNNEVDDDHGNEADDDHGNEADDEHGNEADDEHDYEDDITEEDDDDEVNEYGNLEPGTGNKHKNEMEEMLPAKRLRFDIPDEYNDNKSTKPEESVPESSPQTQMRFGAKILQKLGHTRGKGLGKYEQGVVEPLKASDQKGKRGLGYHPEESGQITEHPEEEKVSLIEEPVWIENPYSDDASKESLRIFMIPRQGPPKDYIDDEIEFCNPKVLRDILEAKTKLDDIENVGKIRSRTNPFESVRNGIFLNRAAMKMANMDRVFDYMFTDPKDRNGTRVIGPYDLLYFADVCAGPGGFSEYVFYRKKWRAKGFGFTLRGEDDFRLDEFFAGPCETFEPHYGVSVDGDSGDGDIYRTENIEAFSKFVLEATNNEGVHFMMADGGFALDDYLIQEVVSKQLYLCQCLVALKIVRMDGNFVVKLFDVFTPFSVGLVYLMYRSFEKISIHKPNTSRPANSERYLICQYKREEAKEIAAYLTEINEILSKRNITGVDILELVPMAHLKDDINFFEYIVESNTRIGERQVYHLRNIVRYANSEACDDRQEDFREKCLKYWNIPNTVRMDPKKTEPNRKIEQLLRSDDDFPGFLYGKGKEIENLQSLTLRLSDRQLDWYWMVLESGKDTNELRFYLGLGRTNVYRLEGKQWVLEDRLINFQLPEGTLIYGEIAEENVYNPNSLRGQYRVAAFHIVDGLFLGGEDIRFKHITERRKCCELFAKSLTHSKIIYRAKKLYEYNDLAKVLSSSLGLRTLKNRKPVHGFNISHDRFIIPKGLLFFCGTRGDWYRHRSSRSNTHYFFNKSDGKSVWESDIAKPDSPNDDTKSICTDFKECFTKRYVWWVDDNDLAEWTRSE